MDAAGLFENAGPSSYSPQHPSLFELLAQDQLKDLLQPAVRYVLTFLTQRYPRYLLRILNNHEEFYACLSFLLERHHLKKHNASLSEHFYNLRYVPTNNIPTPRLSGLEASGTQRSPNISRQQRYGLLAILVGIPYVRARAQDYFERLGGGLDPDIVAHDESAQDALPLASTRSPSMRRYRAAFKLLYPYVNLAWELYLLGYDISYMFDKTPRWRPWFNILGVKLERVKPDRTPGPNGKRPLTSYLPPLLPPLLLLLKFSQWYYSPTSPFSVLAASKKPDASSMHSRIAPPPPLPILKAGEKLREYGVCPVCEQKWQNPTALPSGWVMCWRCAWDAIDETGACPVTGAAVGKDELRRVLV